MFSLLRELGLPVTTECGPKSELKKLFGKKTKTFGSLIPSSTSYIINYNG